MNIESAAVNILKRGVDLDTKKRYTEALVCYQEGLQVLVDKLRGKNLCTRLSLTVQCTFYNF